ncbi:hypothetical protein BFV67_00360 [Enterobacter roggenkampii]|nr:hypothetical protein BFV67_00360 [Enterobacter roggenkampii]
MKKALLYNCMMTPSVNQIILHPQRKFYLKTSKVLHLSGMLNSLPIIGKEKMNRVNQLTIASKNLIM